MERFILINNERNRIKVFEPFEDVSKSSPSVDAMTIIFRLRWDIKLHDLP